MLLAIFIVTLAGVNAYVNEYDQPFTFKCPASRVLSSIASVNHNYYEDRIWDFGCTIHPLEASITDCEWTSTYANEFKEAMVFQCTGEGFITGVESYHDNRYEDRRFKFQCCQSPRTVVHSCYFTTWTNNFDGNQNFSLPKGKLLRGVVSIYDTYYKDRRYQFEICDVNNQPY
ncbi:dermatopontin-like [Pomacea canaliculata]|uniref:dermatopontin-like n=1 Tax=Pomacea canaliculata TaxID=400727 RepID=UPI000D738233|nr:dermatopontin-like [Pomacea canaliculata]